MGSHWSVLIKSFTLTTVLKRLSPEGQKGWHYGLEIRKKKKKKEFFFLKDKKRNVGARRQSVFTLASASGFRALHSYWHVAGMEKAMQFLHPICSNLSKISYIIETRRLFLMK